MGQLPGTVVALRDLLSPPAHLLPFEVTVATRLLLVSVLLLFEHLPLRAAARLHVESCSPHAQLLTAAGRRMERVRGGGEHETVAGSGRPKIMHVDAEERAWGEGSFLSANVGELLHGDPEEGSVSAKVLREDGSFNWTVTVQHILLWDLFSYPCPSNMPPGRFPLEHLPGKDIRSPPRCSNVLVECP